MSTFEARYDRLAVLAEVSQAFAQVATDYESLLIKIARTSADLIGDGCVVTLLDNERIVTVANAHVVPELEEDYRTYLASVPATLGTGWSISAEVIRTGRPTLIPDVDPGAVAARSDEQVRPLLRRIDVRSLAVVPIRVRGVTLGTLSLFRSGGGRSYNQSDVVLLCDLADRAGLAIDNARMYSDLERRVALRTRELEEANRELEAFSYSVAHDLRSPLRSIDGFAHALIDDYAAALDAEGQRYLSRIRSAAQHMGVLIDGLLALAHVGRVELRHAEVSLSDLASQIVARLREEQPGRTVDITITPRLTAIGDPRLVETILQNLIDNAWKFTSKTDHALIELATKDGAFFVRDNGAGFDPALAGKLFGAFQRLHDADEFPGTGIGLGTVQRAVQRHGGKIWAESVLGHGATFFFTLS